METPLSILFKEICREIGCSDSDAAPALKILNDNFFFKLRDIKNLNVDLWRILNLPLNLYFILQERVKVIESQIKSKPFNPFQRTENNLNVIKLDSAPLTPLITNTTNIPIENKIEPSSNILTITTPKLILKDKPAQISAITKTNVIITPEEKEENQRVDFLKSNIYKDLDRLTREINDIEKTKEILKKFHTIVINIISNPNEEKFRKLNVESKFFQNSILPYRFTFTFLETMQFAKTSNQYYEYIGDIESLNLILERMNEYLVDRKFAQLDSFNPYATHIVSISGGNQLNQIKKVEQPDFDDLIRKERERRDEIIINSKSVERTPKIFQVSSGNFMSVLQNQTADEEKNGQKIEEQDFYKYAMSVIKGNTDKFVVKRRTDFENLIKKPVYNKATIRIKFPNEILFQGEFAMMETIEDVYNFVKENLNDPSQNFSLFTSFPKKVYSDKKATVYSQGLAPTTVLNISFPNIDALKQNDYQYLTAYAMEKFTSNDMII